LLIEGVVFRGSSGSYFARPTGADPHHWREYVLRLRGNLKKELVFTTSGSRPRRVSSARKRRSTDPIAVGDRVLFDPEQGTIEQVLPRTSELARLSPTTREQHVLVANLDVVFIVFAAARPDPELRLLDRFLVVAEAAELTPQIVVNKIELVDDLDSTRALFAPYEAIGYRLHFVSAKNGQGMDEFRAALRGKISALAGPSGVGKSSLLNTIQPGLKLKTGETSVQTGRGRHTTTSAELIPLRDEPDTWIADTPGFQNLEFWDVAPEDIVYCFPEFEEYAGECQFGDCTHRREPGCAVRSALESGTISGGRYQSYVEFSTAPGR
jgi:ribosome biogenesis GTPase